MLAPPLPSSARRQHAPRPLSGPTTAVAPHPASPPSPSQFWIHSGELQTPATFELEAVNGQRVVATVDNATQGETKIPNFPTAY